MVLFRWMLITFLAVNFFIVGRDSGIAYAVTQGADPSSLGQSRMKWDYVWFLGGSRIDERGIPIEIIDQGFAGSFATALLNCEDAKVRHGRGICFVFPLPLPASRK